MIGCYFCTLLSVLSREFQFLFVSNVFWVLLLAIFHDLLLLLSMKFVNLIGMCFEFCYLLFFMIDCYFCIPMIMQRVSRYFLFLLELNRLFGLWLTFFCGYILLFFLSNSGWVVHLMLLILLWWFGFVFFFGFVVCPSDVVLLVFLWLWTHFC